MKKNNQKPLIGAYLMLIIDNKILLQKRRGGYYDNKYSLVAGHTEEGETIVEAIIREAKEESNITLNPNDLEVKVMVHRPNAPYKDNIADIIDVFVLSSKYEGTIKNNEEDRCSELCFYPLDDLPEATIPYVKQALDALKENQFYIINKD